MSPLDSIAFCLAHLGTLQLGCALVAATAYTLALNATLATRTRWLCAFAALGAATVFAASSPDWPSGVSLLVLGVLGLALFAALAWLVSRALGVDRRPVVAMEMPPLVDETVAATADPTTLSPPIAAAAGSG